MLPRKYQHYTAKEIMGLTLKDDPFLRVPVPAIYGGGRLVPIQGTLTFEVAEVLGDLPFTYEMTTHEWIPLFNFDGDIDKLNEVLDFELALDAYSDEIGCWVTVKGFPEEQYYRWDETGTRLQSGYEHDGEWVQTEDNPAPQRLIDARDRIAAAK